MLTNLLSAGVLGLFAVVSATPIAKRTNNQLIQAVSTGQCLSLPSGTSPANGVQLVLADCSGATQWDVNPSVGGAAGTITVSGTNGGFALDAGDPIEQGNPGKIWQTVDGVPQQNWLLYQDQHIGPVNGPCLQHVPGQVLLWQCGPSDTETWQVIAPPTGGCGV